MTTLVTIFGNVNDGKTSTPDMQGKDVDLETFIDEYQKAYPQYKFSSVCISIVFGDNLRPEVYK